MSLTPTAPYSSITLYGNKTGTGFFPLTPEKNFLVDGTLENFFASVGIGATTISRFQYIRPEYEIDIKISTNDELKSEPFQSWQYRYVRVVNYQSPNYYYYFVVGQEQRAQGTIVLHLRMDVLNTFMNGGLSSAKVPAFSPRTLIHRQHRDRYAWETYGGSDHFVPIVDYVDEGINPVRVKRDSEGITPAVGGCWNLIFRNDDSIDENAYNEVNPVTAWLAPDKPVRAKYQSTGSLSFVPADFATGYTFISGSLNGIELKFEIDGNLVNYPLPESGTRYIIVHRHGAVADVYLYGYVTGNKTSLSSYVEIQNFDDIQGIEFVTERDEILGYHTASDPTTYPTETNTTLQNEQSGEEMTKSIYDVDRKDSKIIKIISLPFPPVEWELVDGCVNFKSSFVYDHGDRLYKLVDQNPTFDYVIDMYQNADPLEPLGVIDTTGRGTPDTWATQTRGAWLKETKLYHSSFYQPKFVYDSFSFSFDLERVNGHYYRELTSYAGMGNHVPVEFSVSTTFNSKFMFTFPNYVLDKSIADYENVLPIARNNELPVFTSQYVNYLRTAYRYDLKNMERTKLNAIMGGMGSAGTMIASIASGNVLGFGAGLFGALNTIMGVQRAEEGLKSKLAQLESQAVSVGSADDVDLMKIYTKGGLPHWNTYRVTDLMKGALEDLFYYFGYVTEARGIPDTSSRVWFNFVQADVEFENVGGVPIWGIDRLKEKFAEGVTYLHKYGDDYDPKQTKENLERALLDE